jgi:tetratricopeptide (TPR) repeat protein
MADIFVSYTSSDRDWAFWIGHELYDLGHTPHIHEWELFGGANIMAWMEARTDAADHVLCVVSKKYLKAPYSSLERQAAEWAAVTGRPNFALPVFVEPCEAPILSAPRKRCDLHGIAEDEARARLKAFLEPASRPPRGPFPGGAAPRPVFPGKVALSNVPIRVPEHFLGRDEALKAIEKSLARYEGRVAITAVHGLRGVGKTTLAAVYAEKHRGDYRATWWIRAQTESSMRADLVAFGVRLGWVGAEDKEEPALAAVTERLRHEGEGVLLIYDNAIDAAALKPYLPRGGAVKVLVTSNAPFWRGVAEPVEIRLWPKAIGADYLIARTGREAERAAAEVLSDALGGLPLAHEQAAAYCERLPHLIAICKKEMANAASNEVCAELLDRAGCYFHGLGAYPGAQPLFVRALEIREKVLGPENSDTALSLNNLASLLQAQGKCVGALPLYERALAIYRKVLGPEHVTTATSLNNLASLLKDQGNYAGALPLAKCALAIYEKVLGPENPDTALSLHNLASLLQAQDDLAGARPLYERALAISEKALGSEHPATNRVRRNIARLLLASGNPDAALISGEAALVAHEKILGQNHPWTKGSASVSADALDALGRAGEAAALRARYGLEKDTRPPP